MTSGNIFRQLVEYAVPLMLGNMLQQLYTVVDCITVGRLVGKEALAAISATEVIINTIIGLFFGISSGATIVIAQEYGSKDKNGVHDAVHTTMSLTLIMGVIVTIAGIFGSDTMLKIMSTPEDVFPYAKIYLEIYFSGIFAQVIYNMGSGILRAVGDSKRPLVALTITSVLNIVLDIVLVAVFDMGVAGVAIATIFAQFVSAVYLLYLLISTREEYALVFRDLKIHGNYCRRILSIGVPLGVQRTIVSFSNTLVTGRVSYFGSDALAGFGVFKKAEEFTFNVIQSLALADSTFVGQNYGAGNCERANKGTKVSMAIAVSFTVVSTAIIILLREYVVMLFNDTPEVVKYGSMAISTILPLLWISAIFNVAAGEVRGYGNGNIPMIVALLSFVAIRQIYLAVVWGMARSVEMVFLSYPVGWIFAAVIMVVYMFASRKKRRGLSL